VTDGGVHRTVPALEVHKLQAFLQFDQYGLQSYHGVVNALEPGDDTGREFEALGCEWAIDSSTYWNGKIEHPETRRSAFARAIPEHDTSRLANPSRAFPTIRRSAYASKPRPPTSIPTTSSNFSGDGSRR
jgi:hypothetical protein